MQRVIATNGMKSVGVHDSWDFVEAFKAGSIVDNELYSRVAAVFRAFNLKANTVGGMPFALLDKSGNEYDNSATWENKVGFLPNPSELFRVDTLSYMATNTIYNLRTSDILGRKAKGLYHAVPTEFAPVTNGDNTTVAYIERNVGAVLERYQYPDDKRLVRMWRMDHTTDLLPSKNTEFMAIANAAGIVYYADTWIKHYYQGGGIKPTLVAMKGLIDKDSKEEKEKAWWNWLLGLGKSAFRKVKIYNAETIDVKAFGDGVGDLKDNVTYEQAIANIAMGHGIPLSLLMANSANYATAKEEKATWYENDIIPFCDWLAYEYNRQVFEPLGLFLEFHPETLDPQQEDETERAVAMGQYMDVINKCPSYDVFIGMAATLGLELSDDLTKALEAFYADKEKKEKEMQAQMQSAGVVVGPDGKPVQQKPEEKPMDEESEEEPEEEDKEEDDEEEPPAKWVPSLEQFKDLDWWKTLCFRKLKRGESLTFEYAPRYGGLPEEVRRNIVVKLGLAKTEDDIKAAFTFDAIVPETKSDPAILALAEAINRMADATKDK